MDFLKSLTGMQTVAFTSASPEKVLDSIIRENIPISHILQKEELSYQIQIPNKYYRKLTIILRKQNGKLTRINQHGFYWSIRKCFHRPVLIGTVLLLLVLSCYLPTRIFFIHVEGAETIPGRVILSAAERCGICFGAPRKLVRSEQVKNSLLSAVPQLQWAGINTSGCTAVISVRERSEESSPKNNYFSNLVADRDGYILSATVTSGTPHICPGESVTKGQLLISGYTDCGITIRTTRAEGEIYAQTNRKLNAVMPASYSLLQTDPKSDYEISLLIRKKRINLWKCSRISGTTCGRMYEEYYISLPGGFQLPIAVCIDQYFDYTLQDATAPEAEAQIQLQRFSENYITNQMLAGKIIQKKQKLSCSDSLYLLENNFVCTEMIGKERREQIGVINGKRN